jgi:hypothetical protein
MKNLSKTNVSWRKRDPTEFGVFVESEGLTEKVNIPMVGRRDFHLFISRNNPGAAEVVAAAMTAFAKGPLHTTDEIVHVKNKVCPCMLLHLTNRTWSGVTSKALAREVMQAMTAGAFVLLAHERPSVFEDAAGEDRHACEFKDFFATTPEVLTRCQIYREIAVPMVGGAARPTSQLMLVKAIANALRQQTLVKRVFTSAFAEVSNRFKRGEKPERRPRKFKSAAQAAFAAVAMAAPPARPATRQSRPGSRRMSSAELTLFHEASCNYRLASALDDEDKDGLSASASDGEGLMVSSTAHFDEVESEAASTHVVTEPTSQQVEAPAQVVAEDGSLWI